MQLPLYRLLTNEFAVVGRLAVPVAVPVAPLRARSCFSRSLTVLAASLASTDNYRIRLIKHNIHGVGGKEEDLPVINHHQEARLRMQLAGLLTYRLIRYEFVLHDSFLRVAGRAALLLLEVILPYLQLQFKLTLDRDR